jgi:hypothetical protein
MTRSKDWANGVHASLVVLALVSASVAAFGLRAVWMLWTGGKR